MDGLRSHSLGMMQRTNCCGRRGIFVELLVFLGWFELGRVSLSLRIIALGLLTYRGRYPIATP